LVFDLSIFQTQMWSGAVDIAQARDANLITFVGLQFGTGAQANVLHSLIDPSNVDGLVLNTANLVLYNDLTELIALLTRCHPLPATSIAFKVEGVPSSAIRCETGMYDLVSHLIEVHGCRRIAIIRGPEGHPEDDMRYRGYAEALAAHNLPLDPNLVTPHYNWPSGGESRGH
jgi:DNA-binding LacI/PurR family transcriptional regulator